MSNTEALTIQGIEVTQATQYYHSTEHLTDPADQGADNAVQLVAGKPAWVRVYVRSNLAVDIPGITGTLSVRTFKPAEGLMWLGNRPPEPPGTVTARVAPDYATERGTLAYTLNFVVPGSMICGYRELVVKLSGPGGEQAERRCKINLDTVPGPTGRRLWHLCRAVVAVARAMHSCGFWPTVHSGARRICASSSRRHRTPGGSWQERSSWPVSWPAVSTPC